MKLRKSNMLARKNKTVAVLFSGGKDSCLALLKVNKKYKIKYLLTMLPENQDSFMFHKPDEKLLKMQVKQLGLPLIKQRTKGEKEKELEDLRKLVDKVREKVDIIVIGGIASSYQQGRFEKIVEQPISIKKVKVYAPLANYTPYRLWGEIFKNNFEVIITKVASEGIPKEVVGKILTKKDVEKLRQLSKQPNQSYQPDKSGFFRTDFEGGDAETAVLYMPLFKKKIQIKGKIVSESKYRHFLKIEKIKEK